MRQQRLHDPLGCRSSIIRDNPAVDVFLGLGLGLRLTLEYIDQKTTMINECSTQLRLTGSDIILPPYRKYSTQSTLLSGILIWNQKCTYSIFFVMVSASSEIIPSR